VGDVIQGKVERGDYGPRFKWEKVPDDAVNPFPPGPQASKPSLSAGVPPPGPTQAAAAPGPLDERSRRIERQHSQEMALRALTLGHVATDGKAIGGRDHFRSLIREWTDWFVADLDAVLTKPVLDNGVYQPTAAENLQEKGSLSDAVDSEVASGGLVEMTDETF
jgi:hypothetical protein